MYKSVLLAAITDVPDVRLRAGASSSSDEQLRLVRCAEDAGFKGGWGAIQTLKRLSAAPLLWKIVANFLKPFSSQRWRAKLRLRLFRGFIFALNNVPGD